MSTRKINIRGNSVLECPFCKKIFKRPNCHIRNQTHCCSRSCSRRFKPRTIRKVFEYKCIECAKIFTARLGRGGTYEYCSIPCMAKSRGRKMRGAQHPKWAGGTSERPHSSRALISKLKKQRGKCEKCGNANKLHGHHRIPWKDDESRRYNPDNIQILCHICHSLQHPNIKKFILSH